ncbi:hypothetical protein FE773_04260 [Caminibacter mediatlanticus TB-2]|nr:nucleotidyltransferase domain-containing protein [Caminibacter mediatlanticus]QCT94416.1 hypothetical protein FE773_04260 [Caminibacter mediatlanticus TB-2]
MNKEIILEFLSFHKEELKQKFKIEKIGVFGSILKKDTPNDIDFYVEFKEKNFDNVVGLLEYLENNLHYKIDIFYPHKLTNKKVLEHIKKEVIYG